MSLQATRGAGGKFTGSTGGGAQMPPAMAAMYARMGARAGGSMSFDRAKGRGTGYGMKGGDGRVRMLQQMLNQLGLKDAGGRPLAVDGKLGPRTTAAIQAAQRKLGVTPDGVVTPKLMAQLSAMPKPRAQAAPTRSARSRMTTPKRATKTKTPRSSAPRAGTAREWMTSPGRVRGD